MTTPVNSSSSISRPIPYGGLVVLGFAVFISVTAEMIPTGLLPEMSAELGVGEAQIGLLVTFFALSVVVTSVPLVSLTRRFSRHGLIVVVLFIVSGAALFSALAPSYEWLAVARIIGGIAHGLFWAVVGAYSGHLVHRDHVGRAVAIITSGGTLAIVFGVPLATIIGQAYGWRAPFAIVAVLGVIMAVLIAKYLPRVSNPPSETKDARGSRSATKRRRDATVGGVVLICVTTAVIMVGHYTLYTYITPFLTTQVHIPADRIGAVLFANGAGGAVGLVLVAVLFNRRPMLGIVAGVAATTVAITVLAFLEADLTLSIAAIILWGIAFGMLPSLLQARLLHVASARIRDTSVAFFSSSFNVGIATGAVIGGALLSTFGLGALPLADLLLLAVGLILLLVSVLATHRRRGTPIDDDDATGTDPAAEVVFEGVDLGEAGGQAWGSNVAVTDLVGPNRPVDGSV